MHVVAFHEFVSINSLSFKGLNPWSDVGRCCSLRKLQALKPLKICNFMNLQAVCLAKARAARLRRFCTKSRPSPSFVENCRLPTSFVSAALYLQHARIVAYKCIAVRGAFHARMAIIPKSPTALSIHLQACFLKNAAQQTIPRHTLRAEQLLRRAQQQPATKAAMASISPEKLICDFHC
jgi:hypothetical protein